MEQHTIKLVERVNAVEFTNAILGSRFDDWSWWQGPNCGYIYDEGFDWGKYPTDEKKSFLTVWIQDPNGDGEGGEKVLRRRVSMRRLADAYTKAKENGHTFVWTDLDSCSSDTILQFLTLGEVIYG